MQSAECKVIKKPVGDGALDVPKQTHTENKGGRTQFAPTTVNNKIPCSGGVSPPVNKRIP